MKRPENLEKLNYKKLQEIAKASGIRANQKAKILLEALTLHFKEINHGEQQIQTSTINVTTFYQSPNRKSGVKVSSRTSSVKNTPVRKSLDFKVASTKLTPLLKPNPKRKSSILSQKENVQVESKTKRGSSSKSRASFAPKAKTSLGKSQGSNGSLRRGSSVQKKSMSSAVEASTGAPARITKGRSPDPSTPRGRKSSGSARDILSNLKPNMTGQELKDNLRAALDRKVVQVPADQTGHSSIPRFMVFLKNKERERKLQSKADEPVKKQHSARFGRMESIVDYEQRKKQRAERLMTPVKLAKPVSRTPKSPSSRLFKPTVTSVSKVRVNFNSLVKLNAPKLKIAKAARSVVIQTPENAPPSSRKSIRPQPQTPGAGALPRRSTLGRPGVRKSVAQEPRKSTVPCDSARAPNRRSSFKTTPLKTNTAMNASLNCSASMRPTFDLQSSLAKPLTYRPHVGKLKAPVTEKQDYSGSHRKPAKTVVLKGRQGRRDDVQELRKLAKDRSHMSRRGIQL